MSQRDKEASRTRILDFYICRMKMMRKRTAYLMTGLFLIGVYGTAQAGCNNGEDFFTEGPPYECETSQNPVVHTKVECTDHESFFTEGMRISPCAEGPKTLVSKAMNSGDSLIEGYSDEELIYVLHSKRLNNIETAAGN